MALKGWLLDKSAAARSGDEQVRARLSELAGSLYLCPVGQLEQLYSARSARDYDALDTDLRDTFRPSVRQRGPRSSRSSRCRACASFASSRTTSRR